MTAAVLTAPAVPVVPAESRDADLVRLCTEGVALAAERDRIRQTASDDEFAAIIARLDEMAPPIGALVPQTEEGLQAKAAFVLRYAEAQISDLDGCDETRAVRDLLRDALRPRPTLALPVVQTPVGTIAARVYQLYEDARAFDCGTPKRAEMGAEAAGAEMERLHDEAIDLMDDAMERPAASLTDAVALLDFALSEADGLDAIVQDDPTADARLDAIKRVLHGCCRAVALVAGVPLDGLLGAPSRMDRIVFPDVAMPAVAVPADAADVLEIEAAAERARQARQAADALPCDGKDWDRFAEVSGAADDQFVALGDLPVRSLAGARRLAAALMERQRKEPDGFNHGCVENAALRLLENLAGGDVPLPDPDAGLREQCCQLEALVAEVNASEQDFEPGSATDIEQRRLLDAILATVAVTTAGQRDRARAYLAWTGGLDGRGRPASVLDGQQMWPILRDLAGSLPVPSIEPDPDLPLLRMADEIAVLEEEAMRLYRQCPDDAEQHPKNEDEAGDRTERSCRLADQMAEREPSTAVGLRAFAKALLWSCARDSDGDANLDTIERLGFEMARFILGSDACGVVLRRLNAAAANGTPEATVLPVQLVAPPAETSSPTFALIAAEAERFARLVAADPDGPDHDERTGPFLTAYFGFADAAVLYPPASLAETMTLAALTQEQANILATVEADPERCAKIGERMRGALANVVKGIHRFGGVPMSAADPALDYLTGTAGAAA